MTIFDNNEVHIFQRITYNDNLSIINKWSCKWCTKDTISWNNLTDKGKLYGLIDKINNEIYSIYILHDGTIRRIIDANHKPIQSNKINSYINKYLNNL